VSAHQYDEGHTVAGWTGFGIATVGTAVLGVGVCLVSVPILAAGLAITVASVLVTWALHLTGWGTPPGRRPWALGGMRGRERGARAGHPGCVGCRLAGRGIRRTAAAASAEGAAASAEVVPVAGEVAPAAARSGS
jgi:hypothetical protein